VGRPTALRPLILRAVRPAAMAAVVVGGVRIEGCDDCQAALHLFRGMECSGRRRFTGHAAGGDGLVKEIEVLAPCTLSIITERGLTGATI